MPCRSGAQKRLRNGKSPGLDTRMSLKTSLLRECSPQNEDSSFRSELWLLLILKYKRSCAGFPGGVCLHSVTCELCLLVRTVRMMWSRDAGHFLTEPTPPTRNLASLGFPGANYFLLPSRFPSFWLQEGAGKVL